MRGIELIRRNRPVGYTFGFILGAFPDSQYEDREMQLVSGDVVVFYTDGLTELNNEDGEEFGVERLIDVVRARRDQPLDRIIEEVRRAARKFRGPVAREDDVTLMLLRWGTLP